MLTYWCEYDAMTGKFTVLSPALDPDDWRTGQLSCDHARVRVRDGRVFCDNCFALLPAADVEPDLATCEALDRIAAVNGIVRHPGEADAELRLRVYGALGVMTPDEVHKARFGGDAEPAITDLPVEDLIAGARSLNAAVQYDADGRVVIGADCKHTKQWLIDGVKSCEDCGKILRLETVRKVPLHDALSTGRPRSPTGIAPCGHPGENIVGSYVRCLSGCEGIDGAVPGRTLNHDTVSNGKGCVMYRGRQAHYAPGPNGSAGGVRSTYRYNGVRCSHCDEILRAI